METEKTGQKFYWMYECSESSLKITFASEGLTCDDFAYEEFFDFAHNSALHQKGNC